MARKVDLNSVIAFARFAGENWFVAHAIVNDETRETACGINMPDDCEISPQLGVWELCGVCEDTLAEDSEPDNKNTEMRNGK